MKDCPDRSAPERHIDGPYVPSAVVPTDLLGMPWRPGLADRRRLAWADVRRIARYSVRAGAAMRRTGGEEQYQDWIGLRVELSFALKIWASYRAWTNARE